jgi:hypothetical protein
MRAEEIVEKLEPWLARHRRPAWRPVVEEGDGLEVLRHPLGRPGSPLARPG